MVHELMALSAAAPAPWFLFLSLLGLAWGQAPGDFDTSCRTGQHEEAHIFPDSWEVLLDSYDYSNLYDASLTVPGPVWVVTNEDEDGGNTGPGFNVSNIYYSLLSSS